LHGQPLIVSLLFCSNFAVARKKFPVLLRGKACHSLPTRADRPPDEQAGSHYRSSPLLFRPRSRRPSAPARAVTLLARIGESARIAIA
jgi:hypothetical protein